MIRVMYEKITPQREKNHHNKKITANKYSDKKRQQKYR